MTKHTLRGPRDDGSLNYDGVPEVDHGNFRKLLQYHIPSRGHQLERHLQGQLIFNEIIECCGEKILICFKNQRGSFLIYSIIFDETTDIAN